MEPNKRMKIASTLITCHNTADADAFGSLIAASKLFKNSVLLWPGSTDALLQSFVKRKVEELKLNVISQISQIEVNEIQTVVVVDTARKSRVEHLGEQIFDKWEKLESWVFDHHPPAPSHDLLPNHKVHRPWGSCCAVIVEEIRLRNEKEPSSIQLTREESTIVAIGIHEDTGSLLYECTSTEDIKALLFLHSNFGVDQPEALRFVQRHQSDFDISQLSHPQLDLYEQLESNLSQFQINGTQIYFSEAKHEESVPHFSAMVNKFLSDKSLPVLFVIAELGKVVLVVGRASKPVLHVGNVLSGLHGGGHASAGSATLKNLTFYETKELLIAHVQSAMSPPLTLEKLMTPLPVICEQSATLSLVSQQIFQTTPVKKVPVVESFDNPKVLFLTFSFRYIFHIYFESVSESLTRYK